MMMMRMAATTISYSISFFLLLSTGGGGANARDDDLCHGKSMVATELNFFDSVITENELHDGGVLRYENIGIVRDRPVDFVVKVVDGTTYSTTRPERNGKTQNGELFGVINLMNLRNDELMNGEGNFEFCFYDHETKDLTTVDSFRFSVYDIDERNSKTDTLDEKITMDATQIADFILYPSQEESEIQFFCEDGSTDFPCDDGVRTVFHSSTPGTGDDNPRDPNNLSETQKKRSIVYSFKDTSCFTMTFSHYCPVDKCRWYGGGNFLFSGDANQLIEEGECVTSPPQSTLSPTKAPIADAGEEPTAIGDGDGEGCLGKSQSVTTELDFFNSIVTENALSTGGVIRYENIGVVRDRNVDLVVSLVEGTSYSPAFGDRPNGLGSTQMFGNIGLETVKGDTKSGEGNFRFCFYDNEDGDLTTVDSFRWSVYDIDERNEAANGIKEKMIMDVSQADDFILYPSEQESEVKLSCEDGTTLPCDIGVRTVFHSSTKGGGEDNPTDPNNMTEQQKERSVVFTFKDTSCWEFTYDHYCRIEVEEGGICRWYGGGNFLYSGDAREIIDEGECVTLSPTEAPAVVRTNPPTDDSIVPPTTCPDDVKLVKQNGITPFPVDTTSAVKIVSQDTSTVTVKLEQAWTSSTMIDYIYYEYKEDLFDLKCYEEVNVDLGITYDTITIQCNVMFPKAHLQICVADNISKEFLRFEDDATIPQCCHSTTPEDTPIVCYTLEINCETECDEDSTTVSRRNLLRGGSSLSDE